MLDWHRKEHSRWGEERKARQAKRTRYHNTVVMQRSGSKRLYDHNIFLRHIFLGAVLHKREGDLGKIFDKALFVDIGSGILYGAGAPTVRDIFEDDSVWTNLSYIIATDINGPDSRYVDIYRLTRGNLPFPVKQISMKLIYRRQFRELTGEYLGRDRGIIFRSANSGPDIYYPPDIMEDHFRAMAGACEDRPVLYFFSKFILFKAKNEVYFQKIGEIDSRVGMNHYYRKWEYIDWSRRTLDQVLLPEPEYIEIRKM